MKSTGVIRSFDIYFYCSVRFHFGMGNFSIIIQCHKWVHHKATNIAVFYSICQHKTILLFLNSFKQMYYIRLNEFAFNKV